MKAIFIIYLLGYLFTAASGSPINDIEKDPEDTFGAESRLNIILVTISSLRADHVSCLGYDRETTPNFDKFANNNFLFTNAFATSSWQMPAVGSIFTSLYPGKHGATHIDKKLNSNVETLAGVLKENGYYTVGFSCNPRLSSENGFGKGFNLYDDYSADIMLSSMAFGLEGKIDINKRRTNHHINDAAVRWLENNTHRPFFLYVHYYDNHWDFLPPAPYDTLYDRDYMGDIEGAEIAKEPLYSNRPSDEDVAHIIALYDGEVKQTDNDLGELLEILEDEGRFDDSVIMITGDHGEQFYEHGHTSHHGIFDELIRVPLAISLPGSKESRTLHSFVSGVDMMPTILDFAGISVPVQCEGRSLKYTIQNGADDKKNCVFIEYSGGAVPDCYAARFERYKFVWQEGDNIYAYDLKDDPGEMEKIPLTDFTEKMNQQFEKIRHQIVKK